MIDLSNSRVNDEDLRELTKSTYFVKLEIICVNSCGDVTVAGVNHLISSSGRGGFVKLKEI